MSDLEKATSYLAFIIFGVQKSLHDIFLYVVTSSLFNVFGKLTLQKDVRDNICSFVTSEVGGYLIPDVAGTFCVKEIKFVNNTRK